MSGQSTGVADQNNPGPEEPAPVGHVQNDGENDIETEDDGDGVEEELEDETEEEE